MAKPERFTSATGAPVPDNTNILTAGRRGLSDSLPATSSSKARWWPATTT
ncbi:hypothetical protein [Ramlibacter sp.]|nr:hypothetical protein [Ramlibacter sp.]MDB5953793.1 hypothetical protein [Ramlibacter sp.]